MTTKQRKPEEVVTTFGQVEALIGQGMLRLDVIRQFGQTEQIYDSRTKSDGGT